MADRPLVAPTPCLSCGAAIAPSLLSCPACGRLVHAEELSRLATEADAAEAAGDVARALESWRRALVLLPDRAPQRAAVGVRIERLAAAPRRPPPLPATAPGPTPPQAVGSGTPDASRRNRGIVATIGAVLLLLLTKGKFLIVFVLAKIKFLALGLTKLGTFSTMLASLGVYWAAFGWWFALGLVVSLYVHEMGHVAEMVRRGMKASAPMFVPGLGAFVRMNERPASAVEGARIGLAGPSAGAALAALAAAWAFATGHDLAGGLARMGAWLNAFNLLPVWQLDGGRAFGPLSRWQRAACAVALAAAWAWTREGLFALLAIVAAIRVFGREADERDRTALLHYLLLVAVLAALLVVVPGIDPDASAGTR